MLKIRIARCWRRLGDPFVDADGHWHRRVPLWPQLTIDGYLVWLLPCYKRFVPATDWEGSNWYYEWSVHRPPDDLPYGGMDWERFGR